MDNVTLKKSLQECQDRLRSLEERLNVEDSLITEHGVYFTEEFGKRRGPFCTRCWGVNKNLLLLQERNDGGANCPECQTYFEYLSSNNSGDFNNRGDLVSTVDPPEDE